MVDRLSPMGLLLPIEPIGLGSKTISCSYYDKKCRNVAKGSSLPMFAGREVSLSGGSKSASAEIFENPILKMPVFFYQCSHTEKKLIQEESNFCSKSPPFSSHPLDDGEWVNFVYLLVYYYCLCRENITLYKTCRKKQDWCI